MGAAMQESEKIVRENLAEAGLVSRERIEHLLGRGTAREVGRTGEEIACAYLEREGYEVVERNWRCPFGEADIVCALPQKAVVLVEVKTRLRIAAEQEMAPEIAVGPAKRERYGRIALHYLNEHPGIDSVRFDVIALAISRHAHSIQFRHICSAFYWDD